MTTQTVTLTCTHLGGPKDGLQEQRVFNEGQQALNIAEKVALPPDSDLLPWYIHRYNVMPKRPKQGGPVVAALLIYKGYTVAKERP